MEEKVERKCGETIAPDQQKREGKLLLIFLSSFFFSCLSAIGFYPLFPNTFWPQRPEKEGITFCFSLSLRLIRALDLLSYFFVSLLCQTYDFTMLVLLAAILILTLPIRTVAYLLPMLKEIESSIPTFAKLIAGPSFPLRYMCVHAAPPSYYGHTHTLAYPTFSPWENN